MTADSPDDRIRALEDEVRRLTLMLESAPDFITRITVDGKFLYLNRLAPGFPGRGATFSVFLPRVTAPVTEQKGQGSPAPALDSAARVLLVEDEAVVRAIVERTLVRAGYRVVVATSAEEALELGGDDGQFDLVVTDIVMPGMNGWALGRRLRQRWPGLRVLYISGYTEDVAEEGGANEPGAAFLQKPFLPVELLASMQKLLDAKIG